MLLCSKPGYTVSRIRLTVQMIEYTQIMNTVYAPSGEGSQIVESGSHEYRVWAALPTKGTGEPMGVPELKVRT